MTPATLPGAIVLHITWWGEDSNLRRLCQQIYSLPRLTASVPHRIALPKPPFGAPRPLPHITDVAKSRPQSRWGGRCGRAEEGNEPSGGRKGCVASRQRSSKRDRSRLQSRCPVTLDRRLQRGHALAAERVSLDRLLRARYHRSGTESGGESLDQATRKPIPTISLTVSGGLRSGQLVREAPFSR